MAGLSGRRPGRANRAEPCADGRRVCVGGATTIRPLGAQRRSREARNAAVVRRVVEEIWNESDLQLADVLFAPCYANHGGIITDVVRGPEAIKLGVVLYRTAFPEFRVSVDALVSNDNLVELSWTARAAPPSSLSGTTLTRLAGGQILESWTTWNPVGLLQRLGVLPPARPTDTDP